MAWGGNAGPRGYHHGNLREALIDAALALIAEKGPAGFTIAEAARAAGVSPAAPYRHFRDRDELMAGVASRGFARFEAVLARGWNGGLPDPRTAFDRLGRAYLHFARTEPAYYAAMFEGGVSVEHNPGLLVDSERAFAILRTAAEALCAAADAGAPHLGARAWHRRAVRPARRRAPQDPDDARGPAGSRHAGLSPGAGLGRSAVQERKPVKRS